jgi:hypothetical protein
VKREGGERDELDREEVEREEVDKEDDVEREEVDKEDDEEREEEVEREGIAEYCSFFSSFLILEVLLLLIVNILINLHSERIREM